MAALTTDTMVQRRCVPWMMLLLWQRLVRRRQKWPIEVNNSYHKSQELTRLLTRKNLIVPLLRHDGFKSRIFLRAIIKLGMSRVVSGHTWITAVLNQESLDRVLCSSVIELQTLSKDHCSFSMLVLIDDTMLSYTTPLTDELSCFCWVA